MIRIVCQSKYLAANGDVASNDYETFDLRHDELERWLKKSSVYAPRCVVGAQIFDDGEREASPATRGRGDSDGYRDWRVDALE